MMINNKRSELKSTTINLPSSIVVEKKDVDEIKSEKNSLSPDNENLDLCLDTQVQKKKKKTQITADNHEYYKKLFLEKIGISYEQAYKDRYDKLKVHLRNNLKMDEMDAEDLATQAFINVLTNIETYDAKRGRFSTWLYTIARNAAFKQKKDQKKQISLEKELSDNVNMADTLTIDVSDREKYEQLIVEKYELVIEAINNFDGKQKDIILQRELGELTYKDIARLKNMNLSTVKSQIRTGRKKIIQSIAQDLESIEDKYYDHFINLE